MGHGIRLDLFSVHRISAFAAYDRGLRKGVFKIKPITIRSILEFCFPEFFKERVKWRIIYHHLDGLPIVLRPDVMKCDTEKHAYMHYAFIASELQSPPTYYPPFKLQHSLPGGEWVTVRQVNMSWERWREYTYQRNKEWEKERQEEKRRKLEERFQEKLSRM